MLAACSAPGSTYRGSIVVDMKNASGLLVFKPSLMANVWEWAYGK